MSRQTRPLIGSLVLAAILLCARVPAAQAQVADPQNFPVERLRLSVDRDGILSAEWGGVLPHLAWDAGLWVNLENDPLVLRDRRDGARLGSLVSTRAGGSLVGALGLFGFFQIGIEAPVILYQARPDEIMGPPPAPVVPLAKTGFGDIRVVPKLQILDARRHLLDLSVQVGFTIPSGKEVAYRGEQGASAIGEIAVSRALGGLRLATNVGYHLRSDSRLADQVVSDELLVRVGAGYRFSEGGGMPLELAASYSGAVAAASPFEQKNQAASEVLGQATYTIADAMVLFLGSGLGLSEGFGTPDWRVFAGTRFGQRDPDPDRDGIEGSADRCPRLPEDKDGFQDTDGCLDLDNDQDGIADAADKAPNDPEDRDGFLDDDGVPDLDNDEDGVSDASDRCPLESEPANDPKKDGCPDPDPDGDGIARAADQCPDAPEDRDQFEDEDGCADPDNDEDGVLDAVDRCVSTSGPVDNRGCPDTDKDGDRIVDRLDNCPEEKGEEDNQGCKKEQLVVLSAQKIEILDTVYFRTGKAVIRSKSFELLNNVAAVIAAHPEIDAIEVQGHTDDRGDDAKNLDLSQRRAQSVVDYLIKKGVARERLRAKGYGETKPIESNESNAGRSRNRRVEFLIGQGVTGIEQGQGDGGVETRDPDRPLKRGGDR